MSITSESRAISTVNGYRNRMERIMNEINQKAEDMRLESNNRKNEMNDIIQDIQVEYHRVLDIIDVQQFEDTDG